MSLPSQPGVNPTWVDFILSLQYNIDCQIFKNIISEVQRLINLDIEDPCLVDNNHEYQPSPFLVENIHNKYKYQHKLSPDHKHLTTSFLLLGFVWFHNYL